jgi:hypothetical protein
MTAKSRIAKIEKHHCAAAPVVIHVWLYADGFHERRDGSGQIIERLTDAEFDERMKREGGRVICIPDNEREDVDL